MTNVVNATDSLSNLPDITQCRLIEFRQRRLWLRTVRGLSATLGLSVFVLLMAILVDAWWINDAARWLGSLSVYLILFSGLVLRCWLPWQKSLDPRNEARRLERFDPRLREQLLSAVELSTKQPGVNDSQAFRAQLQQQVARKLESVDVNHLLPWSRVQRRVSLATIGLASLILLCLVPQLHFPQRLARVLLPLGDWGRVSRIAITLERPTPHSKLVPRDEIVAITARVAGPRPESLTLETRSIDRAVEHHPAKDDKLASINMTPIASDASRSTSPFASEISRFEHLLPAHAETIEYRIQGAGARTPWYQLTTLPSPRVIDFEKVITPPQPNAQSATTGSATTGSATQSTKALVEDHGHLQALIGSHVTMRLTINQPTSVAELRWEAADDLQDSTTSAAAKTIPLRHEASSDKLLVDFVVTRSIRYKIHLQSSDSNFTNTFSPSYHVQAIEDQPPMVTWIAPQESYLIAAAQQIISLENEITDELPLASLERQVRINGSQWQSESLVIPQPLETQQTAEPQSTVERSKKMRSTSQADWELDLQTLHLKAGDQIEVKLAATDRQGQTGESPVLQVTISSTSLVLEASPAELKRREVAASLARVEQKLANAKTIFDQLLAPQVESAQQTAKVPAQQKLDQAIKSMVELNQEVNSSLVLIEQATGQTTDALNGQALIHVGEALLPLANSASRRVLQLTQVRSALSERLGEVREEKVREGEVRGHDSESRATMEMATMEMATMEDEQLSSKLIAAQKQLNAEQHPMQELVQHFETLTTYDVVLRHTQQLSRLASAEWQLAAVNSPISSPATPSAEQLQRSQYALTEQLKESQRSILDSVPLVRQETRGQLQQHAAQLGQQIEAAERFTALSANQESSAELARSLAQQLQHLRTFSRLDSNLPAAVKIAQRRLSELAPPTQRAIDELSDALAKRLPSDNLFSASSQQLARQRELQRAAPQGDRLYAGDLGSAQRALEILDIPMNADSQGLEPSVRDIATAIETLQAIHQVTEVDLLIVDLLKSERVDGPSRELAWHGPRAWDAIEQRFEQAINNLRTAEVPLEIVQGLEQIRYGNSAVQATQEMNHRLWQAEAPQSVIVDLENLRAELSRWRGQLAKIAQAARRTLADRGPKISQLAKQAAEEVREVEQQSTQLAQSIERNEVPDLGVRLEQLANRTDALQPPIERLRDALVDQADAQNLLDRKQTQVARSADAAIELVDGTSSRLQQSQAATAPAATPTVQSANLREAAADQSLSAAALEQLANIFEELERGIADPASKQWAETLAQLQQRTTELADADGDAPPTAQSKPNDPDAYAQAEELARMAEQDPQAVLEQLERELATNEPMSREMSAIARQVAEQSLRELDRAAEQQLALTNTIELSDPNFKAQKELLLHDLQITSQGVRQLLDTINSHAKWTTETSKREKEEKRLTDTEHQLRLALERLQQQTIEHPFEQLRNLSLELQTQLTAAQHEFQTTSGELAKASFEEFHQSGADLANRRREMRDRQRRVQQENARDAQTIERKEQQRLRQLEDEVRQTQQTVQRSAKQLQTARQQLEKKPDQKWLSEQVRNLEVQLELERSRQSASKKLQDAIVRRVESAQAVVEATNSQQPAPLDSVNPTAQLAAQLSKQAAEVSRRWAEKLGIWDTSQLAQAQASADELARDEEQQQQIGINVAGAADSLSRATRHETRLDNAATSEQLNQAAVTTQLVVDRELNQALQQIVTARAQAVGSKTPIAQASPESTQAVMGSSRSAEGAIQGSANLLRQILASQNDSPATSSNGPPSTNSGTLGKEEPSPLDAADKARLLDELDQRVNGELNLGKKEDDSQAAPSSDAPNDPPPTTLSDAANQLSQSLSQSRQPPTPSSATADLGSATESLVANAQPQSPVAVQVVEVDRRGGNWGQLREQTPEELMESRRETIAPRFRKQVEAYFRELAERGAAAGASPASSMNERQ